MMSIGVLNKLYYISHLSHLNKKVGLNPKTAFFTIISFSTTYDFVIDKITEDSIVNFTKEFITVMTS